MSERLKAALYYAGSQWGKAPTPEELIFALDCAGYTIVPTERNSMTSEMIERVADALMKIERDDKLQDYYKMAIAAIEAMHETTPAMRIAGSRFWGSDEEGVSGSDADGIWRSMIDAALGKVDA